MERSSWFRISLLLTLGFGLIISDLRFERNVTWALFFLYGLSAVCQRWIMSGRSFDVRTMAEEENAKNEENKRLYYCGVLLEANPPDEEKTAIREILDPRRSLIRRLAKYGLVAVYIFLIVKFRINLMVWDVFFLLGATIILISATSGHMLLAFALNAVVALPCALTLSSFSGTFTLTYLFLSCLTFASHRFQESAEPPGESPSSRETKMWTLIRQSAVSAAVLFGLGTSVHFLLPKALETDRIQRTLAERAISLNRELGERFRRKTESNSAGDRTQGSNEPVESRNSDDTRGSESFQSGSRSSPSEIEEIIKAVEKAQEVGSINAGNEINRTDAERILHAMSEGSGKKDEAASRLERSLEASVRRAAEADLSKVKITPDQLVQIKTKMEDELKQARTTPKQRTPPLETSIRSGGLASENLKTSNTTATSGAEKGPGPMQTVFPLESKTAPRPLLSESLLRAIIELLRVLLVVTAAVFLYAFMRKLCSKHDPNTLPREKRRKLTGEERMSLREEFRRINGASLTEPEEVIARYALFLKLMDRIGLPKPDAFPPHEFEKSLRGTFPKLDSAVRVVTDGFCDGFYGKSSLGVERLERFRADHGKIFRALT